MDKQSPTFPRSYLMTWNHALMNAVTDAVIAVDTELRIQQLNIAAEQLLGGQRDNLLGRSLGNLWTDPSFEQAIALQLTRAIQGEQAWHHHKTCLPLPDGPVATRVTVVAESDGVARPDGAWLCITPAPTTGEHQERRYQLSQEAAGIGSWEWEVGTGQVHWSNNIEPMFGYRPGEFPGTFEGFISRVHPGDRDLLNAHIKAALEGTPGYEITYRVQHPDGNLRWLHSVGEVVRDHDGHVTGMLGTVQDVTERCSFEQALRESEAKFRNISEKSLVGIYLIQDGLFKYVNPRLAEIFAYQPEALIDKLGPRNLVASDDWPRVEKNLRRRLEGETSSIHYQFRGVRQDGKYIQVEVYGNRIHYRGQPAVVGTLLDITDRRQAEEASIQFRALIENSHDFIAIADMDKRVLFVNRAGRTLVGLSGTTDLAGMHIDDFLTPEALAASNNVEVPAVSAEGHWEGESTLRHFQSGEAIPVTINSLLLRHPESGEVLGLGTVQRDIRQQRSQAAALQAVKNHLQALYDASPDMIFVQDSNGTIVDVNTNAARGYGYSRNEILQLSIRELSGKDYNQARAADKIAQVLAGQSPDFEWVARHKDGHEFPVEVRLRLLPAAEPGQPRQFIAVVRDISRRKQAESDLRESEATYRSLVEQAPEAITVLDLESGKFVDINEQAMQMFKLSHDDLLQTDPISMSPPVQADGQATQTLGRHYIERAMHGEKVRFEWLHRDSEERVFPCDISLVRVPASNRQLVRGTIVDISERKAAEQQLLGYKAHLEEMVRERTAKLEELNRELEAFSYSVSHDLRAPLRAIDGFSEIIHDEYRQQLDNSGQEYLDRIRRNARHMGELIDDLLSLSRVNRHRLVRKNVDLSALAGEIVDDLRNQLPGHTANIDIATGLQVRCDRHLVKIMLTNLLGNAWKFTARAAVPRIQFGEQTLAGEAVYFVRDNGAGFDMTRADKLFQPFQRMHRQEEFEGTGIGLATVARIVQRHGGRIWAESAPGEGAAFYFTLSAPKIEGAEARTSGWQQG